MNSEMNIHSPAKRQMAELSTPPLVDMPKPPVPGFPLFILLNITCSHSGVSPVESPSIGSQILGIFYLLASDPPVCLYDTQPVNQPNQELNRPYPDTPTLQEK